MLAALLVAGALASPLRAQQPALPAHALAAIIPNSEVLDIPGRDHMRAVGDRVYKAGVLDFLSRRP